MIKILKYTEYLYLVVAFFSAVRLFSIYNEPNSDRMLFAFFLVISLGMFFFRRNYRKKFENRQGE
ncbi:MAG: hypothetical protein CMC18_08430 [Flavobacteriaceae bacterium]|nr:hypothetical protein [Flavobacteriaceae bacterium]